METPRFGLTKKDNAMNLYSTKAEQREQDQQAVISERSKDLLTRLIEIIEDGNAPDVGELYPDDLVDDYYQRLVNVILEEKKARVSGDPTNGDELILIEQDATSLFVSVFNSDGYTIPQVEKVLEKMCKTGAVKMKQYDTHPHLGNIWWYYWAHSGQPVESIPLKLAKEYGYDPFGISGPPENVLVDTKTPYEVDEQIQSAFGPAPQWLTKYAADMARSAAETLDREIMGEDPDPELFQPGDSPIEKLQKTEASELFIAVLQTAIAALTYAEEHGCFISPSAAAEVWSFVNGYEGGLDFEEILKGLQVEDIDD